VVTLRTVLFVFAVCLLAAVPATAQIYTWHDGQGTLVLSSKPRADGGDMTTYAEPGVAAVRPAGPTQASSRFDDTIEIHATRHGLSPDLVRAVIQVESAFNPSAISSKGAMGLMQLMPATASEFGVRNPFQPEENIGAGVAYLKRLLTRYDDNVELALAAYNAGPGNVEKYGDVPPFRETQRYVKKIAAATQVEAPPPAVIYKWFDLVNGQPLTRYSNKPPTSGAYEIVGARR